MSLRCACWRRWPGRWLGRSRRPLTSRGCGLSRSTACAWTCRPPPGTARSSAARATTPARGRSRRSGSSALTTAMPCRGESVPICGPARSYRASSRSSVAGSAPATSRIFSRLRAPATTVTELRLTPNAAATKASAAAVALPCTARSLTRTTRASPWCPPTPGRGDPGRTRTTIRTPPVCARTPPGGRVPRRGRDRGTGDCPPAECWAGRVLAVPVMRRTRSSARSRHRQVQFGRGIALRNCVGRSKRLTSCRM